MENEIKKLNATYEKLRIECDELAKKHDVVLINNQQLEDQLREEKFLTQEAEEMRAHLAQKKTELESMLADYEQRMEENEEQTTHLTAEKQKLRNQIEVMEEQ